MTMDGLPLNLADISVALILLVSALLAFLRGFFREVMAIAAWVGAFFVALYGFTHVQPYARDLMPIETVADLATGVGLFVVAVVIFSTISHALARSVTDSGLGAVDRALGFVFGLVRGPVIVCLIFLIIQWAIDDEPKPRWIAEARALRLVEKGAEMLVALVPENIRSDADRAAAAARRKAEDEFKQKALERLTSPPPKDTNTNSNAPDQESGYTDAQRREMLKAIRGNQ